MPSIRPERYHLWLALAAFLAPLIGGQLSLDSQPLLPGGLLTAIFREPQGAALAHFLIFLPIAAGLLLALGRRSVLQVPHARTGTVWLIFLGTLGLSVLFSGYKTLSIYALAEWAGYILAFFTTIALAGRGEGPKWILGAFALGCAVVATLAIREYATQPDPTWRVIANWSNPNALAGLMAMGTFAGIGLALCGRLARGALGGIGAVLCVATMLLTGSKGGLLAFGLGVAVLLLALLVWGKTARPLLAAIGMVALGVGLSQAIVRSHRSGASPASAMARVTNAGTTQEQSAGFRRLLWQTSIALIKENPVGYGIGTFRHHSAKPGLITQTQLAHQSYLQIGVEAGVLGLLAFAAALLLSLIDVFRGSRNLPTQLGLPRAGLLAALVALGAHSAIDSDFSQFGLGVAFFVLLGVLYQLSPDATAPEFSPKGLRAAFGAASALCAGVLLYFGILDIRLGQLRYAIAAGDVPAAQAAFESAAAIGPSDARVWFLGSRVAGDDEEIRSRLEKAIKLGPTPMLHRALSDVLAAQGDAIGARRELNASLRLDPNNLFSLRRLLDLAGDAEEAERAARRLVAVEETSYFKVRSIPELVPTETYEARAFLAKGLTGAEKPEMLKPALAGYVQFAKMTVPTVVAFATADMDGGYGGVTRADALAKLEQGLAVAAELAPTDSAIAEAGRKAIQEAMEKLSS